MFSGKIISVNNYFLIARQGSGFEGSADIVFDEPLTENNSLVLKNSSGEISDKLGFSLAQDFETQPAQSFLDGQSLDRKWNEENQNPIDTDNNFNDFEAGTPTPKAKNITWAEPIKDTTPPTVNFSLEPIQNNPSFVVNFEITDPIGTVTPSGADSFVLRWKEETGDWQTEAEQKIVRSPTSHNFAGERGKTYYFQINGKDLAGNESGFLPEPPAETKIENLKPILINEIQIEGETTKDDWVELYNPNDIDIFLKNYNGSYVRLVKRAKTSADATTMKSWSGEPDAKIPAKGFYLWASSSDEIYLSSIGADAFTKQNISNNNGIALRCGEENTGEIIDAVGWGDFDNVLFETVAVPLNPGKNQSIKRKEPGLDTNDNSQDFIISETPTPKSE